MNCALISATEKFICKTCDLGVGGSHSFYTFVFPSNVLTVLPPAPTPQKIQGIEKFY